VCATGIAGVWNRPAQSDLLDADQIATRGLRENLPSVKASAPTSESIDDPLVSARRIKVTLRSDLQVSRQIYQNKPVCVMHDPVAFRSHRLKAFQYRILAMLDPERTLQENFQSLVAKQELSIEQEVFYYQLISSFGRLGLLVLPGRNGTKLFRHHQDVGRRKRRSRLFGFLFLRIPLVNPDQFLTRTVDRVSWLFSRTFLGVWLVGVLAAGIVIASRFGDVVQPFSGILAARNLP